MTIAPHRPHTASLDGIERDRIVAALEQAVIREDITYLIATGDHIDKTAWQDHTHDHLAEARAVADAVADAATSYTCPTYRLYEALDEWTAEREAIEAAWQEERRVDLAFAGRAWAE